LRCGAKEGGTLEVAALIPTSSSEARAGNQWMPSFAQPPSLQAAAHAGAPCPPDVKAAMIAWWGPIIHEFYLGSEGARLTHDQVGGMADAPGLGGRRGDRRNPHLRRGGREAAFQTGRNHLLGGGPRRGVASKHVAQDSDAALLPKTHWTDDARP